jgi:methyltransferase (TIGR00027 family)
MQHGEPSRTARGAALLRALHQTRDRASALADPYVARLLDPDDLARAAAQDDVPGQKMRRLFMAARSRIAEDAIAAAIPRGLKQVIVLGAGLDTFSLRNPHRDAGLVVYEVDHPATQGWKRDRLAAAGLAPPENTVFVAVDFEHDDLSDRLAAAGLRFDAPVLVMWLGVVPYLTADAIAATLDVLAGFATCDLVFDYSEPPDDMPEGRREHIARLSQRVARAGEPFRTLPSVGEVADWLGQRGFHIVEDVTPPGIIARFFPDRPEPSPSGPGPHIVHARRP